MLGMTSVTELRQKSENGSPIRGMQERGTVFLFGRSIVRSTQQDIIFDDELIQPALLASMGYIPKNPKFDGIVRLITNAKFDATAFCRSKE